MKHSINDTPNASADGLVERLRAVGTPFNTLTDGDCETLDEAASALEAAAEALEPFANMCRALETRATVTFGKPVEDRQILCETSGEAASAVVRMADFRKALAALAKMGRGQ